MEKTLSQIGNSLALVIDKPIRKMLGIGRRTKLKVWTDGKRLLVEPLPDVMTTIGPETSSDDERVRIDAYDVMTRLMRRHGMSPAQFKSLHHSGMPFLQYWTFTEVFAATATPDDLATMRRLEACLLARQAGTPWDDAIALALQRVPVTCRDSPNS